jgi:ribosomal-protein-alanine N-acetyltransferase
VRRAGLRRRRIGTRLILFAEERILRDAHNVFMCVSSFNTDAQRLYSRIGYARIGEVQDYLVEGASEILLRKRARNVPSMRRSHESIRL